MPDIDTKKQTKVTPKTERPRLHKVILINDDFTPREFVVLILEHIFGMGESEATQVMLQAHNNGVGVVGIYPFSVAETKCAEVSAAAQGAFDTLDEIDRHDR